MTTTADTRRFHVHPAHDRGEGHVVADAMGFEDAALAFVERWSPAPDAEGDVRLIVCDCDTGRTECFCIDLEHGEAEPCG